MASEREMKKRDRERETLKRRTGSVVGVWEERKRERDLEKENVQRCWSSRRSLQKTACYSLNPYLLLPSHKCIQIALCQCMSVRVWISMGVCECERAHVRHTCHTFDILRESLRVSNIWVLPRACAIMSAHNICHVLGKSSINSIRDLHNTEAFAYSDEWAVIRTPWRQPAGSLTMTLIS